MNFDGVPVYTNTDCPKGQVYYLTKPVYMGGELVDKDHTYPHFKMHPDTFKEFKRDRKTN